MAEYISKEAVLSKCDDMWDNADETTQTGVDTINTIDKITDFIESLPAADVISRKEVIELIETFKVVSTQELSKSDFDRNDTLRLLQDTIRGVTWEDVL